MNAHLSSWGSIICLLVFALVLVIYTGAYLPDQVATHFDVRNQADGWMTRNEYLLFTLLLIMIVPAAVSVAIAILPRKFPQLVNIPNRDYWLSVERREESTRYLASHGRRLGCMMIMMMTGLHCALLFANSSRPPTLPPSLVLSLLVGFLFALVLWVLALYRRFSKGR